VYGATEALMPINSFNSGSKVAVVLLAMPGTISPTAVRTVPGPIGEDSFDSHASGHIYVIRRSSQCLPCFLVHW
jgi:hypothetical protein